MNYNETLDWLFHSLPAYHRVGAAAYKANLDNTEAMMEHLGHPERAFRSVHVAGTNGKGSVSHMMAALLHQQGLKVGLYTSPHLVDFRERIRIDGEMISKDEVVCFVENNRPFFESRQLSFFEMTVGMAFDAFRRHNVDIAVVEVGMGGRLDSTNVITPLLSVITNIGLEHTQFLGDSLEKIAGEKAGIIKPGVPVVVGESHPETEPVFRQKAAVCGSRIVFADRRYRVVENHDGPSPEMQDGSLRSDGMTVDVYRDGVLYVKGIRSPLGGIYQLRNLATLLAACDVLNGILDSEMQAGNLRSEISIDLTNLQIPPVHLHGRWEKVFDNPPVIAETAHNPDGIKLLLDKLHTMRYSKLHLVYGCVNDKDYGAILDMLPPDACYYFTRPSVERGLDENTLAETARLHGRPGATFTDVNKAVAAARNAANADDLVIVTGSIFLVADLFAECQRENQKS